MALLAALEAALADSVALRTCKPAALEALLNAELAELVKLAAAGESIADEAEDRSLERLEVMWEEWLSKAEFAEEPALLAAPVQEEKTLEALLATELVREATMESAPEGMGTELLVDEASWA